MKASKNQTQLPLSLDLLPAEQKDTIKQHWNVTFARQKKISPCAKRIMAVVVSQIKEEDKKLKPFYRFHMSDIVSKDAVNPYKEVKLAFNELTDLKWLFEDLAKKRFVPRHLLDTTKTIEEDGFECGLNNGYVTVVLNKALTPFYVQLAHYSTYELKYYMTFKSWYSMRMFELLSAWKDTGEWVVSIRDFRELMDCEEKYPDNNMFLRRVLTEPLEELAPTKLAFTYEALPDLSQNYRGRKQIAWLKFKLKSTELRKIPEKWFTHSKEHQKVLVTLLYDFKVKEFNISKYIKAIGIEKAKELIIEWEHRKRNNEIQDLEKYCNSVWCRVGKAAEETKGK